MVAAAVQHNSMLMAFSLHALFMLSHQAEMAETIKDVLIMFCMVSVLFVASLKISSVSSLSCNQLTPF